VITGEKILVTGVSGTVARPIARHLAADNEVWGLARFAADSERGREAFSADTAPEHRHLSTRAELEAAGVRTIAVDLGGGDLGGVPDDFTVVVHLAWMRAGLEHLDAALRTNVDGAGAVLHHCRKARAALVVSGMGVYSPHSDPWHEYTETDPVGRAATPFAPTSPACKLGLEAVARFCARAFGLPVTIARLNTYMGPPESFPGMHIAAVLAGREVVVPNDPSPHNPIHADDMLWQLEPLLDAASPSVCLTNWCGDDVTTAQEWARDAAVWSGRDARVRVEPVPCSPAGNLADPARRAAITGPCRTRFGDAFRRLYDAMADGPRQ
jgi:nucleoside-diphosphate-sugar epimerase